MEIIDNTTGEIVGTAVTAAPATPMSIMDVLAAKGLKVVKQVTRTVLQQKDDVPFCVTFESAIRESEVQEGTGRGGKPKMAAARVADVLNIETGSHQILICNTVLEGELNRNYPDNSFVGRTFLMRSFFPVDLNSVTGKKAYKVFEIIEVAMTGDADAPITGVGVVADGSDPVGKDGKPKK